MAPDETLRKSPGPGAAAVSPIGKYPLVSALHIARSVTRVAPVVLVPCPEMLQLVETCISPFTRRTSSQLLLRGPIRKIVEFLHHGQFAFHRAKI
jgi:hypothetical protein